MYKTIILAAFKSENVQKRGHPVTERRNIILEQEIDTNNKKCIHASGNYSHLHETHVTYIKYCN